MCDVSKVQDLISNQQMLIILLFHYSNIAIVVSLHLASEMLLSAGMTITEWKVSLGVMAGIGPFLPCDYVLIYSVNLAMCL